MSQIYGVVCQSLSRTKPLVSTKRQDIVNCF